MPRVVVDGPLTGVRGRKFVLGESWWAGVGWDDSFATLWMYRIAAVSPRFVSVAVRDKRGGLVESAAVV